MCANSKATKRFRYEIRSPEDWNCEVVHWELIQKCSFQSTRMMHNQSEGINSSKMVLMNRLILFCCWTIRSRKGYGSLLKAFAKVNAADSNTTLVIVGGSSAKAPSSSGISSFIGSSVIIESGMPFEDLAIFRSANLSYPSYYEGQALFIGSDVFWTPVVTVDHGPLPEMVDNTVGPFQMGDVDSMAESILVELSNPDTLV